MAGQERHDLRKVSLRRRVKRIRWFVATTCCTDVIRFDVKVARLLMSELALKEEDTAKALVVIYKKPPHSKPVEAFPFWHSKRQWACYNDNSTFKACWGIPSGSQSDSESATMTIPHSKPVEASLPAVKATVSLLQWQRQASPPTPLRQPTKRACYNRHLLRSTSQQACYNRLFKRAWAITSYIKRIRGNTDWFRSRWMVYCSDEDIACWRRRMMLRLCCSKLLCQAAFPWLLQPWLGARQQLLYTEQLSLLYLFFMLLVLVNLHPYDLFLCWSWQERYFSSRWK